MQKFFTDTIESSFIKELVYSANIPSYDSICDGDYAFSETYYIYGNSIIYVINSGIMSKSEIEPNSTHYAKYKKIREYKFNDKIDKITENYISKYRYYDSQTHYQLGRYLRLMRDCLGVDLMPLYNCYSGITVSDVYLGDKKDSVKYVGDPFLSTNTSEYKVVLVPIRFNKKYTVCIDSFTKVRMKPIFYGNFGVVVNSPFPEDSSNYFGDTESSFEYMSFKNPEIVEIDLNEISYRKGVSESSTRYFLTESQKSKMMSYEKYLYLLIQLPISNNSSILVQEGDYISLANHVYKNGRSAEYLNNVGDSKINRVYNEEAVELLSNKELNSILLSDIQLQRLNTRESYAYSNKLISYLLDNVVTSEDNFGDNIVRVQRSMNRIDLKMSTGTVGVWNNKLRSSIFRKYISAEEKDGRKRSVSDINGFVDRDVEDYLLINDNRANA